MTTLVSIHFASRDYKSTQSQFNINEQTNIFASNLRKKRLQFIRQQPQFLKLCTIGINLVST